MLSDLFSHIHLTQNKIISNHTAQRMCATNNNKANTGINPERNFKKLFMCLRFFFTETNSFKLQ